MSGKEKLQRIWDYLEDMNHDTWRLSCFADEGQLYWESLADYYEDGVQFVDEILQREFPR